ncbi:hypothetical protein D3C76_1458240 [compost metagenome]
MAIPGAQVAADELSGLFIGNVRVKHPYPGNQSSIGQDGETGPATAGQITELA